MSLYSLWSITKLKSVEEAKAGEACVYNLRISDEEVYRGQFFNDHIQYALADVRTKNVMVYSVTKHRTHTDEAYGSITIRFDGIKLAEPDMSDLR